MKKILKFTLVLTFVSSLFFLGCSDKSDAPLPTKQDRFDVLKSYLTNENLDLSDILTDWITTAENVYTTMTDGDVSNDYFIIDIRSAADYNAGHIQWAENSTLGGILEAAEFNINNYPIIVVCYTGQAAGHGVVALRMSGYTNAKVMKWGMCSWNEATAGKWKTNTGNTAIGNANWMLPYNIKDNTTHSAPKVEYITVEGAEVLQAQVAKLLEGGFKGISGTEVLENPTSYFTNNFWALEDVEKYGNIKDAYRINPLTLSNGEYIYLDTNADVVTYCWTGQASSVVTAYLTVLGYNAYSLLYGVNSLIYDNLEKVKWSDDEIKGYPLAQ